MDPFTRIVSWGDLPGPWELLKDPKVDKIFHNAKHDSQAAEAVDKEINGRIEDTAIMAKVLFSGQKAGLKDLSEQWLGVPKDDEEALHAAVQAARDEAKALGWKIADDSGRWGDQPFMADFWLPQVATELERYARLDPERTMLLFHLLNPMLDTDPRLRAHYEAELKLLKVVMDMERRGVRCHSHVCRFENSKAKMKAKVHTARLEAGLRELAFPVPPKVLKANKGQLFNVNSPNQIRALAYDHLKFPVKYYTDKGNPATDAHALGAMKHPLLMEILNVKAQGKTQEFFDTYLMHSHVCPKTKVEILHPSFKQIGTVTFRFSCTCPNLQNVPDAFGTRSLVPIQARMPFGPRPGKVWLHADWSQIEMWIFAGEANDKAMLEDLHTGSLHNATANRIYGKGRNIVAEEEAHGHRNSKNKAKVLNFGVVFCMGVDTMADALECSRSEAKRNLAFYYDAYKDIRPFMDRMIAQAQRDGYIWNRHGWRLEVDKEMAYRAVNYKVQSGAAAHMKEKMLWLDNFYRTHPEIGAELVLTIHDEIVTEVEEAKILPYLPMIRAELEDHRGKWPEFPKLPIEYKITRERWDISEKVK